MQNRRSVLSLAWHEQFSYKGKDWKNYCCGIALSSEPQKWKFSRHHFADYVIKLHQKACRTCDTIIQFFLIQPIKPLICARGVTSSREEETMPRKGSCVFHWPQNKSRTTLRIRLLRRPKWFYLLAFQSTAARCRRVSLTSSTPDPSLHSATKCSRRKKTKTLELRRHKTSTRTVSKMEIEMVFYFE